jgi:hypothetical protein
MGSGGGVWVSGGTFTKTGGVIYGSNAGSNSNFITASGLSPDSNRFTALIINCFCASRPNLRPSFDHHASYQSENVLRIHPCTNFS